MIYYPHRMKKEIVAIGIGIGFVLFVGIADSALRAMPAHTINDAGIFRFWTRAPSEGFGSLCSSRSSCFVFCKSNVGQCQNYCRKNPTHQFCKILPAAKEIPWKHNVITQPLPIGASTVRLVLPALLDAIPLSEIGAFGAHL